MAASGFGAILFTLGVYLLIRTFNSEKKVAVLWHEFREGLLTGRPSFYTSILAIVIIAISVFNGYNTVLIKDMPLVVMILSFLSAITWWIVAAGLLAAFGRVTDLYIREKKILWSYWAVPFSLFTFGFIGSAVFQSLSDAFEHYARYKEFALDQFLTQQFVFFTISGVIIAFIGAVTYHYIKEFYILEKYEVDIEEQTKILLKQAK